MDKLNPSVLKCLHPECPALPNVQLDVKKLGRSGEIIFTKAQSLVCNAHIDWGRKYLEERYQGFHIEQINDPGWLTREQRKLQLVESQTIQPEIHEQTAIAIPKDVKPESREELIEMVRQKLGEQGRRK